MARGAARAVEGGPEAFLCGFDFEKIVESDPEPLELRGKEARKGIAESRAHLPRRWTCRRHQQQQAKE
jgi:hypothetical protein